MASNQQWDDSEPSVSRAVVRTVRFPPEADIRPMTALRHKRTLAGVVDIAESRHSPPEVTNVRYRPIADIHNGLSSGSVSFRGASERAVFDA